MILDSEKNNLNNQRNKELSETITDDIKDTTKGLVNDILGFVNRNKSIIALLPGMVAMGLLDNELIGLSLTLIGLLGSEKWEKISTINKNKNILEDILNKNTNDNVLGDYVNTLETVDSLCKQGFKDIVNSYSKIRKIPKNIGLKKGEDIFKQLEDYDENKLKIFFESVVIPEIEKILSIIEGNKYRV